MQIINSGDKRSEKEKEKAILYADKKGIFSIFN